MKNNNNNNNLDSISIEMHVLVGDILEHILFGLYFLMHKSFDLFFVSCCWRSLVVCISLLTVSHNRTPGPTVTAAEHVLSISLLLLI